MGKIYQVTVQEIMDDGDGVPVIELTAPMGGVTSGVAVHQ